jgi:hypothetical protein
MPFSDASRLQVKAWLSMDAQRRQHLLTHRGGRSWMTLTTGEKFAFEQEPFQKGVVSWIHGTYRPCTAIHAIEKNGLRAV